MGDQSDRMGQPGQVFPRRAQNMPEQTSFDVLKIADPLGEHGVFHLSKTALIIAHDVAGGVCSGEFFLLDQFSDLFANSRCGQDAQMPREDVGCIAAKSLVVKLLLLGEFCRGFLKSLIEAVDL